MSPKFQFNSNPLPPLISVSIWVSNVSPMLSVLKSCKWLYLESAPTHNEDWFWRLCGWNNIFVVGFNSSGGVGASVILITPELILPPLSIRSEINSIAGATIGDFFITVICSSLIASFKTSTLLSLMKFVWTVPLGSVPRILLSMFIFFGSFLLSVQNNKSSIMFIPVIILSGLNFKTSPTISTKTGVIVLVLESYSIIALRVDLIDILSISPVNPLVPTRSIQNLLQYCELAHILEPM